MSAAGQVGVEKRRTRWSEGWLSRQAGYIVSFAVFFIAGLKPERYSLTITAW